jgi:hypothetical protein
MLGFRSESQREWNAVGAAVCLALTERVQIGEGCEEEIRECGAGFGGIYSGVERRLGTHEQAT